MTKYVWSAFVVAFLIDFVPVVLCLRFEAVLVESKADFQQTFFPRSSCSTPRRLLLIFIACNSTDSTIIDAKDEIRIIWFVEYLANINEYDDSWTDDVTTLEGLPQPLQDTFFSLVADDNVQVGFDIYGHYPTQEPTETNTRDLENICGFVDEAI